jgi:hypothetical protein
VIGSKSWGTSEWVKNKKGLICEFCVCFLGKKFKQNIKSTNHKGKDNIVDCLLKKQTDTVIISGKGSGRGAPVGCWMRRSPVLEQPGSAGIQHSLRSIAAQAQRLPCRNLIIFNSLSQPALPWTALWNS